MISISFFSDQTLVVIIFGTISLTEPDTFHPYICYMFKSWDNEQLLVSPNNKIWVVVVQAKVICSNKTLVRLSFICLKQLILCDDLIISQDKTTRHYFFFAILYYPKSNFVELGHLIPCFYNTVYTYVYFYLSLLCKYIHSNYLNGMFFRWLLQDFNMLVLHIIITVRVVLMWWVKELSK